MTFIATVVAKNGVAVIADSLVTTSHPVITHSAFVDFFKRKSEGSDGAPVRLDPEEIVDLFDTMPHHTKDYEDKLFRFDKYTAITTAGSADLNDKRIGNIIEEVVKQNAKKKGYNNQKFETKIKNLCSYLEQEVKEHLKRHSTVRSTTLLVSHYSVTKNQAYVVRVKVLPSSQKTLEDQHPELVTYQFCNDIEKVVCDGQNKIAEKILFGDFPTVYNLIPRIVNQVAKDFGLDETQITSEYLKSIQSNENIMTGSMLSDIKILKLTELSLQQAVDLASLLMRLEMDIQSYTEDIPTVGGVIKLAIVDKNGFQFIVGDKVTRPNNI